jgi:signal transduction histidine kinase
VRTLFRDRDEFVVGAAILATGFSVLTLGNATGWGWVVGVLVLPAMVVRAVWRSMPGWLLLLWIGVPVVVGEASGGTKSAYLVLFVAVVVVSAKPTRLELAVIGAFTVSPLAIWLLFDAPWYDAVGSSIWFGGLLTACALGYAIGSQWELIDELERTQQQLADAAVVAERQRIARELHDVVGHSFTVVLLHLSGARMILDSSPDEAAEALRQAEEVGRQGMDELRDVLLLMRDGSESMAPVDAGDVVELIDRYCNAGMRVQVEVVGDKHAVSSGSSIVLHDVVREALTNVVKHASEPEADIHISVDDADVRVRVASALAPSPASAPSSPSSAPDAPPDGLGLAGLEHRVGAVGGTFSAGPVGDRWVLEACVPSRLSGVPGVSGLPA